VRERSETFADHYSQSRQFYVSQTDVEQAHIADALTFELSKVEKKAIRERMVAHLLNIDRDLARTVAGKLRIDPLPKAATAAREPLTDLPKSPALSILANPPGTFAGRKLGVLVTDGVDAGLLRGLARAIEREGALLAIVAPSIGGVEASDGSWVEADEKIDGGPSVVFDAVAVLPSADGVGDLVARPEARDFVADAFAHHKFIAYVEAARPLLEKAGIADDLDDGTMALKKAPAAAAFVKRCRDLRFWQRG
jgi:catalase